MENKTLRKFIDVIAVLEDANGRGMIADQIRAISCNGSIDTIASRLWSVYDDVIRDIKKNRS